jgi:hypothetical protein
MKQNSLGGEKMNLQKMINYRLRCKQGLDALWAAYWRGAFDDLPFIKIENQSHRLTEKIVKLSTIINTLQDGVK